MDAQQSSSVARLLVRQYVNSNIASIDNFRESLAIKIVREAAAACLHDVSLCAAVSAPVSNCGEWTSISSWFHWPWYGDEGIVLRNKHTSTRVWDELLPSAILGAAVPVCAHPSSVCSSCSEAFQMWEFVAGLDRGEISTFVELHDRFAHVSAHLWATDKLSSRVPFTLAGVLPRENAAKFLAKYPEDIHLFDGYEDWLLGG